MYFFSGYMLSNGQTIFNHGNIENFGEFSFPSYIIQLYAIESIELHFISLC